MMDARTCAGLCVVSQQIRASRCKIGKVNSPNQQLQSLCPFHQERCEVRVPVL